MFFGKGGFGAKENKGKEGKKGEKNRFLGKTKKQTCKINCPGGKKDA